MGRGRPSGYNESVQERADYYVENGFLEEGDEVPTIAGMACSLDVDRSTMYEWGRVHEAFSHTLRRVKDKQERMLASGGLSSRMNSTIVKLMLANHGYSEKTDQTVTSTNHNISYSPDDFKKAQAELDKMLGDG